MPLTNSMVQLDDSAPNQRRALNPVEESVRCSELCVFLGGVLAAHRLIPPGFKDVDIHSIDTRKDSERLN